MLVLGGRLGWACCSRGGASRENGGDGVTRLAVLPFENLGDSADAYFAEGMTDEVRGKLADFPSCR